MGKLYLPLRENDPTTRTFISINTGTVSQTTANDFRDAVLGVVEGLNDGGTNKVKTLVGAIAEDATVPPVTAQSGNRWRVFFSTSTGKYYFELPTADTSLLTSGTDWISVAAGAGLALKNALDSKVADRFGNAGTITGIKFVNRKSI